MAPNQDIKPVCVLKQQLFLMSLERKSYEDEEKSKARWFIHTKTCFVEILLWCSSPKPVYIKSQAFPVEGIQFLREVSSAYLLCFILSPKEGKLWGGCNFGGSRCCRSDESAQRVHCWASSLLWGGLSLESPQGWQWNTITTLQKETLPHLGLPSSLPHLDHPPAVVGRADPQL